MQTGMPACLATHLIALHQTGVHIKVTSILPVPLSHPVERLLVVPPIDILDQPCILQVQMHAPGDLCSYLAWQLDVRGSGGVGATKRPCCATKVHFDGSGHVAAGKRKQHIQDGAPEENSGEMWQTSLNALIKI